MDDRGNQFVDELLDASLRRYASAEPRPGLEGRVLAGVRVRQQAERRRAAWWWAAGMAGVAAMVTLLAVTLTHRHPAPMPTMAKAPAGPSAPIVAKAAPSVPPPVPRRPVRPAAPAGVDSRPQQFPTPRPLSEQEKLLLIYAQSLKGSSAASMQVADEDPEHDLEIPPLSIAAIKIDPLAPPEEIGDEK